MPCSTDSVDEAPATPDGAHTRHRPKESIVVNFRSDNEAPVAAPIMQALQECNHGAAHAYGDDDWSQALNQAFSQLFAQPVRVLPLATGTAGNSIALAQMCPPWGAVMCHESAHIHNDECGAPEFYSNGAKLVPLPGADGKLCPQALKEDLQRRGAHGVHEVQPSAISLTQSTESGTLYTVDELHAINNIARDYHLDIHMDGARFANAMVALDCHPADITWRAGVGMLTFGASKNGAMAAEALILFDHGDSTERLWQGLERRRKRAGHLFSKMRYVSAQLLAYLKDDLWLELARNANRQAARFAAAVKAHPQAELAYPVQANEVFLRYPEAKLKAMQDQGLAFHLWPGTQDLARLVFSHNISDADTDRLIQALNKTVDD